MTTEELRADARSNRDQILTAALSVFRERGIDVPMKEIADRAGVGVGTLYRRFPDRDALISATSSAYLAGLADTAATAWREEPDAWTALARFLRECIQMGVGGLSSAIEPVAHTRIQSNPKLIEVRSTVTDLIERMTAQATADGALRDDIGPADIAKLMTLQIYTRPGESHPEAVDRVVDIMLDGLRAR
ncbi:TetR/AcrR family transcriptional regulator [Nocardia sp. NPDC050175]|uniref:TetR/AcrR family transcriptional regulator n=1 Tax=Nocardia sp. NPDC050175 TaxID=3364317 RepID=UPI0037A67438